MKKEFLSIVITGHVDHGKSTLIGRLLLDTNSLPEDKIREIKKISLQLGKESGLAFITDHLKEERQQDMTIDTTQIFFKSQKRNYVIIDSPGHVEFIKNMLTGATLAEAAVLIVDAKAGVEEQTRRHAYLLGMLGIKNIIAIFNKMDLVGYAQSRFEEVKANLLLFSQALNIKPAFFIPASAREGENISKRSSLMPWYKGLCLLEALDSLKPEEKIENLPLRLPIQDIYEIAGKKIIVGKILSGTICPGQRVRLYPSAIETCIDSLQIFGRKIKKASAGKNIGLTLAEDNLAQRGEVIVDSRDMLEPKTSFKADIFWMADMPLKLNSPLTFRLATQEVDCVVEKIEKRIDSSTFKILEEDAKELKLNEAGEVIFKTARPIVLEKFDFIAELGRFVIEQGLHLQGTGIIT